LKASFYSNSSLFSSDLQLLSKKNAFNDMLTVGLLHSHVDIYAIHRYAVQLITLLFLFFCLISGSNSIQCTSCKKWIHRKCSGIKGSMYKVMKSFICRGCVNPVTGTGCTRVDIGGDSTPLHSTYRAGH